jgi:tripartite-type tricarboxylate transporter receptor subunit TctC
MKMKLSKLIVATFGLLLSTVVFSQAYPNRTITLVVPFPPGGSTDSVARAIGPKMSDRLGQSVIIENKAGATGTLGAGFVKRAEPDGYTLLVTSLGPLVIAPHLLSSVPYDPAKDFDFITVAVQSPNVMVVPANSPYKSVSDVVAALKANPNKVTFASAGSGSSDHLTAEIFWDQTKTDGIHVPYKGGGPAIIDLLGGQVDVMTPNINAVIQHINSGKLRALAVTSNKRSPLLPNVPTFKEAGVNDMVIYSWQSVVAPKGLSPEVKTKVHSSVVAALNDPQVKKSFTDIGFEIIANTPEQFAKFQAEESARWKKIIDSRKITAN